MPKTAVYRLDVNRTLTIEEMSALWVAYTDDKVMSETTYEKLPDSLKAMAKREKL